MSHTGPKEIEAAVMAALRQMVPSGVEVAGFAGTCTDLALPEERALTHKMVQKRANEFLTGRTSARHALRALEVADEALLPGANRAPIWPASAIGSISHTSGFCVATAALRGQMFAIGVDVERANAVALELERYVASTTESERFRSVDDWRTVVFSVKETVFKCLNPVTGFWLDFHDVEIESLHDGHFAARVTPKDGDILTLSGQFARAGGFVISVAWIIAGGPLSEAI